MDNRSFYLVNVFTSEFTKGNPCCVYFTDDLSDSTKLQEMAADFGQPATAFCKRSGKGVYDIRWFAPMAEIGLCGHGTLGSAYIIFMLDPELSELTFNYVGGTLKAKKDDEKVSIIGRAIESRDGEVQAWHHEGFGPGVLEYHPTDNKNIVVMDSPERVVNLKPNWSSLGATGIFSFVVTAKGGEHGDFTSRVLLPGLGQFEDPATGSAHMVLAPFWAQRLGKTSMKAFQASDRVGSMLCSVNNDQVTLTSDCVFWGSGRMH